MSQQTFLYLCNKLRLAIEKTDTVMRKAISVERRVALTLWFLATNADFRTVGHLFGISKASVCLVIKDVCAAIVRLLLPQYVSFPTDAKLRTVVDGFERKFGFPRCVGVVDGTHIPIISPVECPADYHNRKGWHSIIMQGTVNDTGCFVDMYIGWPGRVHDARVFSNSSLYKKGQDGVLLPNWNRTIHGTEVPLVILGDPAYPLLPWLMKAYPNNGRLTQQQKVFNYRLSKTRVVVEHAYGRLKGRWRCLLKRLDINVADVPNVVAACCALHNLCEIHGDGFNDEWMVETDSTTYTGNAVSEVGGHSIRDSLAAFFNNNN